MYSFAAGVAGRVSSYLFEGVVSMFSMSSLSGSVGCDC